MEKSFFKSKGMMSGLLLILLALYTMIAGGEISLESLQTLLLGSGIIGVRDAL